MLARVLSLACAVLVGFPAIASAQTGLSARVRLQGGYTHQTPAVFGSEHDFWTGVIPELSYLLVDDPRGLMRLTYAFTGAVHTRDPAEIANRLTLATFYELSKRTTIATSADVYQTSLTNYLVSQPAIDNPVRLLPVTNSRLLTTSASEALSWEASPVVLLTQGFDATYVTSIDPEANLDNLSLGATAGGERTWKYDSLGADARATYVNLHTDPLPAQKFVTLTAAPRWKHDYSAEVSSFVGAGASVIMSPDAGARTIVIPYGHAALLYAQGLSVAELSYDAGAQASPFTGQMVRTHTVTLRGTTPLSEQHRVLLGGSIGYSHGALVDLRPTAAPTGDFDAFLGTTDVTWLATDWMLLFARGFVSAQTGVGITEATVREAVTIGIQMTTSSLADAVIVPTRLPQRVDRSDATPLR